MKVLFFLSKKKKKFLWSPIYHKIEENYFKGKIWVLYKLKAKTNGKGFIVLLVSVTTLTSGISAHTATNASLTLSMAVWVCSLSMPLRFHISKYLSMRHH